MAEAVPVHRPLEGIGWMLASGLSFVAVNGIVHALGTDIPAAQSAFVRFLWGILFLLPAMLRMRGRVPRAALPLFLGRGMFHTGAVLFWFYAMARLPVAEVTAIGYLNPLLVALGGALIFGERWSGARLVATGLALFGALVVLRPGLRELGAGQLAQVGAATLFAVSYLFTKRLSQLTDAGVIVAAMSLTVTVGLAPFAYAVWVPISLAEIGWLAVVAACATSGHYCMTRAFLVAPLTVTQPVTFLQLLWASLLGALVFAEPVDLHVILGGGLIVAAIVWMTRAEARASARGRTRTESAPLTTDIDFPVPLPQTAENNRT